MQAKTIKGKSTEAIRSALEQTITGDFKPTLAVVFMSVNQDIQSISGLLTEKGIQVFGATTAGEFIDGEIEAGSIVMMLLDMNPDFFKIAFIETSRQDALEDAKKLGIMGSQTFAKPAFIIATGGVALDGEDIVEGITQGFSMPGMHQGNDPTIYGGKAGDDLALHETYVFTNGHSQANAIVALIIDEDRIGVTGIATCGWNAIGTTKTVTRSEGNIVYTIDDKPALDTLVNFLGVEIKQDDDNDVVGFLSSWYYPLQVERENAEPVIRTAMFANRKDRSLICSGKVPQGAKIKFSMPPDFDSIDNVVADCKSVKDDAQQQADALIMFSCVSRHLSFGMVVKEELTQVQQIWNAPMAGFFTYGEYGKSLPARQAVNPGKYEYHNNACCVVALMEK